MTSPVSPKPFKLLIDEERWREILSDPDFDDSMVGAGAPMDTPEDAKRFLELVHTIQAAQAEASQFSK